MGHWTTKPPLGSQLDRSHPLARGLVSWWLFNEGAGSRLQDIAGGIHGTLTSMDANTDWAGGPRGVVLDFDGVNDYVDLGTPSSLHLGNKVSVVANVLTVNNHTGVIFRHGDIGFQPFVDYTLFKNNAFSPTDTFAFSVGGISISHLATVSATANNVWHHVVGSWDGSTQKIYLNGVLNNSKSFTESPANVNDTTSIGRSASFGEFLNGRVSDLRVYRRPLADEEVAELYINPYAAILQPKYTRYSIPAAVEDTQIPIRRIFPITLYG